MAEKTKIQWCHHTFNPWRGCAKVHTGCANCYAWREAKRFPKNRGVWGPDGTRVRAADAMWREPRKWNAAAQAAGERRRVFCTSLADVFEDWTGAILDHEGRRLWVHTVDGVRFYSPEGGSRMDEPARKYHLEFDLWELIDDTPWLDWLLVTKRPERAPECWAPVKRLHADGAHRGHYYDHVNMRRDNVWILTSVSDQTTADLMIQRLEVCRPLASIIGVSAEPLIAPVDFRSYDFLDWIIFGGESGPGARACNLDWIRIGIEWCRTNGVVPFMKQAGAFPLVSSGDLNFRDWALSRKHLAHKTPGDASIIEVHLNDPKGGDLAELPVELRVREFPVVEGVPA